jgi:hypothetical protein
MNRSSYLRGKGGQMKLVNQFQKELNSWKLVNTLIKKLHVAARLDLFCMVTELQSILLHLFYNLLPP